MEYYFKLAFTSILFGCLAVQCWEDIRRHLLYDEVSMLLAVTGFVRSFFFHNVHDSLAGAGLCFLVLKLRNRLKVSKSKLFRYNYLQYCLFLRKLFLLFHI